MGSRNTVDSTNRDPYPCPHQAVPRLTQVTGGPCAPRGAQAVAGDGVTGHPKLAVTLLAAALSERARLTPWKGHWLSILCPEPRAGGPTGWE